MEDNAQAQENNVVVVYFGGGGGELRLVGCAGGGEGRFCRLQNNVEGGKRLVQ